MLLIKLNCIHGATDCGLHLFYLKLLRRIYGATSEESKRLMKLCIAIDMFSYIKLTKASSIMSSLLMTALYYCEEIHCNFTTDRALYNCDVDRLASIMMYRIDVLGAALNPMQ